MSDIFGVLTNLFVTEVFYIVYQLRQILKNYYDWIEIKKKLEK